MSACSTTGFNEEDRCFKLKGKVFIVSTRDTEEIIDVLLAQISDNELVDNKNFSISTKDVLLKELYDGSGEIAVAYNEDKRIAGAYISLIFSGGLFGDDNFPFNSDGRALLVRSLIYSDKRSDSDSQYFLRSDFGADDVTAKKILAIAKKLHNDQYLLMVAQ